VLLVVVIVEVVVVLVVVLLYTTVTLDGSAFRYTVFPITVHVPNGIFVGSVYDPCTSFWPSAYMLVGVVFVWKLTRPVKVLLNNICTLLDPFTIDKIDAGALALRIEIFPNLACPTTVKFLKLAPVTRIEFGTGGVMKTLKCSTWVAYNALVPCIYSYTITLTGTSPNLRLDFTVTLNVTVAFVVPDVAEGVVVTFTDGIPKACGLKIFETIVEFGYCT